MALNPNYQAEVGIKFNDTQLKKQLTTIADQTVAVNLKLNTGTSNQIKSINSQLKDISTNATSASSALAKTEKSVKDVGTASSSASKSTDKLGLSFDNIIKKVATFYTASDIVLMFRQAIDMAVQSVFEFDNAMVEFSKISDLSGSSLTSYINELDRLGETVARTRTDMVLASTEFVKAGFDEKDSAMLSQYSSLLSNVADSYLSVEDSSSFLIAQMKAFDVSVDDSIEIIDMLNQISNEYAVSSSDISTAMPKVSATLAQAGNTLSESYSLLTGALELMPGQADRVARGLRSVTLNLQGMDEDGNEVLNLIPKMESEFNKLGITLFDTDGQIKSTYEIMGALAEVFPSLTKNQQLYYAELIGGKTQVDVVNSLLKNYETVLGANESALESSGSAMKENSAYMESLQAKIAQLSNEFQKLVLGEGGLRDFIALIIDSGTSILKFANSDIGQLTIQMTSAVIALNLFTKGLALLKSTKIVGTLTTMVTEMIAYQTALASAGAQTSAMVGKNAILMASFKSLGASMLSMASAWALTPFGMATIAVAGIVAITSATNNYNNEQKALKSSAVDTLNAFNDYNDSISDSLNILKDETSSRETLIQTLSNLGIAYDEESAKLKDVNELRQEGIDKLYEEAKARAKQTISETGSEYKKAEDYLTEETYTPDGISLGAPKEELEELQEILARYNEEIQNGNELSSMQIAYMSDVEARAKELSDEITASEVIISSYDEAVSISNMTLEEYIDHTKQASDSQAPFVSSVEETITTIDDLIDTLEEQQSAFEDSVSSIAGLDDAYHLLSGAVDEYNTTGKFSLDTIDDLLTMGEDYLSLLSFENGQLVLNKQGMIDLAYARIEEAKANVVATAQTKLAIIANGGLKTSNDSLSTSINGVATSTDSVITGLRNAGIEAIESSIKATTAASGWVTLWSAMNPADPYNKFKLPSSGGALPNDMENVVKEAENQLIILEKLKADLGNSISSGFSGGGGGSSSGGGGGGSSEQEDANLKAYGEARALLDHQHEMGLLSEQEYYEALDKMNEDYLGEQQANHGDYLDEYRGNLEDIYKWEQEQAEKLAEEQEKAYEQMLDDQKDALENAMDDIEDERDRELERMDERIEKMQEEADEFENNINIQIDALNELAEAEDERLQDQIDNLEELKDSENDKLQEQLDSLEELREAEEKEWDDKIEALEKENDLIEEQTELQRLQEALAEARGKKALILEGGEFTYGIDEQAVSTAEDALVEYEEQLAREKEMEELEQQREDSLANYDQQIADLEQFRQDKSDEYDRQIQELQDLRDEQAELYEQQIEDLENYKEEELAYYEERIENLEEKRERIEEEYEQQIEDMQYAIDKFDEFVEQSKENQEAMTQAELEALAQDSEIWDERLKAYTEFVDEYLAQQARMNDDDEEAVWTTPSGGSSSSGSGDGELINDLGTRASGDSSISKSGMYVVGEDPNKEILIGSTLNNNGNILKLNKGDGVVNAKSTSTLAGMLNSVDSLSNSKVSVVPHVTNSTSKVIELNINEINLPQVNNGSDFVEEMSGFANEMIQKAYGE